MIKEKIIIPFDMDLYCILFNRVKLKLIGFSDRFLVCQDIITGSEYLISRCRFDEIQPRDKNWCICIDAKEHYRYKLYQYNKYRSKLPVYHDIVYFLICVVDISYSILVAPKKMVRRILRRD